MLDLSKTFKSLARHRHGWDQLMQAAAARGPAPQPGDFPDSHLREVTGFGSNPGALRMFMSVPKRLAASPALVVALHGCTQDAASYDHGAGWSALARRYGFAVLLPQQQPANNPKNCFSWFQPSDTARGQGEALSIRQMVERAILDHGIDRRRVYVTGLSAGGAMTSVMLATYPDVFAGGRHHCRPAVRSRGERAGGFRRHAGPQPAIGRVGRTRQARVVAPGPVAESIGLARQRGYNRQSAQCR